MNSKKRLVTAALFSTFVLGLLLLAVAAPCRAQGIASPNGEYLIGADTAGTAAVPNSAAAGAASAADAAAGDPSSATDVAAAAASATASAAQVGLPAPDTGWHFSVAPYLWTPWIYGTIGVNGNNADYYVDPSQLFTHFRFGLLGLVDTRYKRIVLPVDILWLRLGDDRAFPRIPNETFANIKFDLFMLTPKVGYRVINMTAIKVDALAGFRYFHFGENLSFNPPHPNLNFSGSQNWVDPLVGGRIIGSLSPKAEIAIAGDVGGWGVGSQSDFQVGGFLGYRIKPAITLQAGYRYLDVDYVTGNSLLHFIISGPLVGVTIDLK